MDDGRQCDGAATLRVSRERGSPRKRVISNEADISECRETPVPNRLHHIGSVHIGILRQAVASFLMPDVDRKPATRTYMWYTKIEWS